MEKIVRVRNVKFGQGIPKICVPLIGNDDKTLIEEVNFLKTLQLDLVEWRVDYYKEVENLECIKGTLKLLRENLGEIPLLATFRSKKEGGEKEISTEYYIELNKTIALTGDVDIIDVELFSGDEVVNEIIECAHKHNVKVIISNHDFYKTPSQEEIIGRLRKMQEMNADMPKIAVMPQTTSDVLTLLTATNEMVTKYADRPIITMSMSSLGIISRLAGETFGSAITFGSAKVASAPGQVSVVELGQVLKTIHNSEA